MLIIAALSWSLKPSECDVAQTEAQVPRLLSPAEDKLLLAQQLAEKILMAGSTKQVTEEKEAAAQRAKPNPGSYKCVCEQRASLLGASRGAEVHPPWEQLLLPGQRAAVWRGLWNCCWSLT